MKIVYSEKCAKKKKKWNPNPWAVCHTTVDKDEEPAKYERCVQHVKEKQAQEEFDPMSLRPGPRSGRNIQRVLDQVACKYCGSMEAESETKMCNRCWELANRIEADPELAQKILSDVGVLRQSQDDAGVKEAKKKERWMQDAVEKPGSFTAWCKRQGFNSVTNECIAKGKASDNSTTRHRAQLAETFRQHGGKKKE